MNYKQIANEYIKELAKNDWFEGVLIRGSFVSGNANENSDIDLYIISSNDQNWRERGNKLFMGKIIEYFINPIRKIEKYFEKEAQDAHKSAIYMFANGEILVDKNGEVAKLKTLAKNYLKKPSKIADFDYKNNCYHIWDCFDELESKFNEKADIDLSYYNFLNAAFMGYMANTMGFTVPINKFEKIIKDKDFCDRYFKKSVKFNPDFKALAIACLDQKGKNQKIKNAKNLYKFLMKEFKDFDINNYSLVSSAD